MPQMKGCLQNLEIQAPKTRWADAFPRFLTGKYVRFRRLDLSQATRLINGRIPLLNEHMAQWKGNQLPTMSLGWLVD